MRVVGTIDDDSLELRSLSLNGNPGGLFSLNKNMTVEEEKDHDEEDPRINEQTWTVGGKGESISLLSPCDKYFYMRF